MSEAIDQAMLAELSATIQAATDWFDKFDYARALEQAEAFFWNFCDNYLELVKDRAYGAHAMAGEAPAASSASARAALRAALAAIVRLFAPLLPFVTEEVWSWWQDGSVHRAPWPSAGELGGAGADGDPEVLAVASAVIAAVRKAKSESKVSMRTEVAGLRVCAPPEILARVTLAESDLLAAARARAIEHVTTGSGDLQVTVTL